MSGPDLTYTPTERRRLLPEAFRKTLEHSIEHYRVLDDVSTTLGFGIPERNRPSTAIVGSARSSVQSELETLRDAFVQPADRPPPPPDHPPPPDLGPLRDEGTPTTPDDEFATSPDGLAGRRRTMLGLVESDARQWPSSEDE